MPKKLSPSANKSMPISDNNPAAEPSIPEEKLIVEGITNIETNPQTLGASSITTPLTDAVSWPTLSDKAKTPPAQRSWAAIASGAAASSGQTQSPKASWAAMASGEIATTSKAVASISPPKALQTTMASDRTAFTSSKSQTATTSWAATASAEIVSTSKVPTPFITRSQEIKLNKLFNELKQLDSKDSHYFKNITVIIYKIRNVKVELTADRKIELISFIYDLNLNLWPNISFVHLFLSLKYAGVFDKEIPQDIEKKQASLFKKLVSITEKAIHDPRSYHRTGLYSFLSQVIKAISTSESSLIELNKNTISTSLKAFLGYLQDKEGINLISDDVYKLVTAIYDLRKKDVITKQEGGILAKPYITEYDVIKDLKTPRKQSIYLFACRYHITRDDIYKNNKNSIEAIYNQAIDFIDPLLPDPIEPFYIFDEINFLSNIDFIDIENCKLDHLMKILQGKIRFLVGEPPFAKFYVNLYNLETTSFSKTTVYKNLKEEYHICLKKNIHKIDAASIAKIESHITKSKTSYVTSKELSFKVIDNLERMLKKICSENSALTKENCLASLDVFSHRMNTDLHWKHFEYFKHRVIPELLDKYSQLNHDEKIKLVKVLPLTKNERNDQICRKIITELHNTFMANTNEYVPEAVLFLNAIANLGNYNSDIIPFIELSRKAFVIDETRSKSQLFKSLNFYSFAYAYFILQEQEGAMPQNALNSLKEEMKEKLALAINFIESKYKDHFINDDLLILNYAHALLKINKQYDVNFIYTETNLQKEIYESLAEEYELEKEKDIQLEASLFGLPGVDIYLNKYRLAIEIDGSQHYQGYENSSVSGKSLMQKAILDMNGVHLINIKELSRGQSLVLEDVKQQLDNFLRKKRESSSD